MKPTGSSASAWAGGDNDAVSEVRPVLQILLGRAAELFSEATKGWTLHQLRHSALTHAAEDGTNTPILLARSRHASVRSLERYARSGPDVVARHVAEHDPAVVVANGQPAERV
jgi:integrase